MQAVMLYSAFAVCGSLAPRWGALFLSFSTVGCQEDSDVERLDGDDDD